MRSNHLRREASPTSISILLGQGKNQSHLFKPAVFFFLLAAIVCRPAHAEIIAVTEVGYYDTPGAASDVAVSGNYAYVADHYSMRIINISNPASPSEVGNYDTPGYASGVAVSGNYAYVVVQESGLRIINISNPASPSEVGYCDTPGYAFDVAVSGNYAYVADWDSGLRIINISNPASPSETGYYVTPGYATDVAVSGNYAYVADFGNGLRIINISNPASPYAVGCCDTPRWARGVAVSGNYAYVPAGGLRIINIINPASPSEVGYCDTPRWARGVAVSGNYAYVAVENRDDNNGVLRIINISNPASPSEVGYCDTPGWACSVAVSGNYAYVADWDSGLRILYCSPPAPFVSRVAPRFSLANSQINLSAKGKDFDGISVIQLKDASQTITGSSLDIAANSLTAHFSLPAVPGLFDLVLTTGAADFVFKTVFTLLSPMSLPIQWQVNDLGKAGNPPEPGPSGIAIGDADRDNQAEVYVANNEHMLFKYKKTSAWNIDFLPETPSEYFNDVLIADGNHDGDWEIYGACSQPGIYQYQFNGTYWSTESVCAYSDPLASGDGDNDGILDIYAVSGTNIVQAFSGSTVGTDLGDVFCLVAGDGDNDQADEVYAANNEKRVFQFKYNGSSWDKTIVAIIGNGDMNDLALGDVDKDGQNELYGANEDKNIYQFQWSGSAWSSKSINTLPGACQVLAISDGDNDGNDEIYVACADGHVYQIRLNGTQWQQQDLGNAGTPLNAIAVGDGDNNFQFEVYAVGENAHVYQFQAKGSDPTPTPTMTPTTIITPTPLPPDKFLKIYQSQINPTRGEEARITWCQPHSGPVTIIIYNMLGEKVTTLLDNQSYPSEQYHEVIWNGVNQRGSIVGSGIYVVSIKAGNWQDWIKVGVIK